MNNNDVNFNYIQCIKTETKFGETIYYNICNNETKSVPWGSADWCLVIFLITFGIVIISFFTGFFISFIKDIINGY